MTSEHENTFGGSPLEDPSRQIRLLHLRPLQSDDPEEVIQCGIHATDLEDVANTYTAISYVWGPENPARVIKTGPQQHTIRYNCWYALWQMRIHNVEGPIWIDSLCINQSDPEEKQAQIAIMGKIYTNAAKVAICLGEYGSDEGLFREEIFMSDRDHRRAIQILSQRPYFRRLWTVQECLLPCPERREIFCGNSRLRWDFLRPKLEHGEFWSSALSSIGAVLGPMVHRSPAGRNIWDLVHDYSGRNCAEPRDKILGLLALAKASQVRRLTRCIDQSTFGIFCEFVRLCIDASGAINLNPTREIAISFLLSELIKASPHGLESPPFTTRLSQFLCRHWRQQRGTLTTDDGKDTCPCETSLSPSDLASKHKGLKTLKSFTPCEVISLAVLGALPPHRTSNTSLRRNPDVGLSLICGELVLSEFAEKFYRQAGRMVDAEALRRRIEAWE